MRNKILISMMLGLGLTCSTANAASEPSIKDKIQQAMKLDYRTEEEIKRDQNRDPIAALTFIGLKDDMKVIEFVPGGGWYTKILGPVLKDKGQLFLAQPKAWINDLEKLVNDNPKHLGKTKMLPLPGISWDNQIKEMAFADSVDFNMTDADLFLNIRMYHNLPDADRLFFNQAVYQSLKKGGKYVVLSHTRRHGQDNSPENWRREDPVRVISEVQAAGFTLTDYSNMFYRADDELRYEVGRKTVAGNTDRFFLVFTKE